MSTFLVASADQRDRSFVKIYTEGGRFRQGSYGMEGLYIDSMISVLLTFGI